MNVLHFDYICERKQFVIAQVLSLHKIRKCSISNHML